MLGREENVGFEYRLDLSEGFTLVGGKKVV